MPVWDDNLTREARRPLAPGDTGVSPAVTPGGTRSLAHDGVLTAVQKDAAEIVARARRDIRRIVTDARRELLELSAQVQAANVEVPKSAPPDPAVLDADDAIPHGDEAWLKLGPDSDTLPVGEAVADDGHLLTETDSFATPLASSITARTFVALFTLAGLIVVAGTLWWMTHQIAPATSSAPVSAPAASTAAPASTDAIPAAAARETVAEASPAVEPIPPVPTLETPRASIPASSLPPPAPASGVLAASSTPRPVAPVPPAPVLTPPPAPLVPSPAPVLPAATAARGPVPAAPPAPATRPETAAPGRGVVPGRIDIPASGRQWLDGYHRQDRATMDPLGAPSLVINDERRPDQKFPFGLEVTRGFEDEQLQLSGDSAVFTARMTERATTGAMVSRVSQTWVRRSGAWQLQEARIVSDNAEPVPAR